MRTLDHVRSGRLQARAPRRRRPRVYVADGDHGARVVVSKADPVEQGAPPVDVDRTASPRSPSEFGARSLEGSPKDGINRRRRFENTGIASVELLRLVGVPRDADGARRHDLGQLGNKARRAG